MTLTQLRRKKEEETPAQPAAAPSHTGLLEIGGMWPTSWDTADPASVDKARKQFDHAINSGYTAQSYKPGIIGRGGSAMDGEVTRTFDPEADVVRMSLPYAGG